MVTRRKSKSGRVLPEGVSERADGRFIYRYRRYGKAFYIYDYDLNELKKKILDCKIDIASGSKVNAFKLTLDTWYPQYIQIYKKNKVKDSTLHHYIQYYNWYVKDSLIARIPIKEMKRTQVVAHFQMLSEKNKLANGTLKALASMLFNALQQCVYDEILNANPATSIMKEIRATPKVIREALSIEETKVMLDFLKIEGTWQNVYLPAIGIGISTGLRFGELFGLTWKEVDFKNHVIYVNHTLNYRDKGEGHMFFITSPKTVNAIRRFPMTEEIETLFKMQRKYQKDMRIRDDIEIDEYKNFVFTTKTGYPYTHEAIVRSLKSIVKRANEWEQECAEKEKRKPIKVTEHTPHVWRHTLTTRLVENKISYERLKIIMGHSSIKTTIDIYTHISEQSLRDTRTDLDGMIKIL